VSPSFIVGAIPLDLGIPGNVTNLTAFEIVLEDEGLFSTRTSIGTEALIPKK
jgi:hypothetical protein